METSVNATECNIGRVLLQRVLKNYSRLHRQYEVVRSYLTEADIIECPYCSFDIVAVNDFDGDTSNYCYKCGTKLRY